jgi:hypothetical protein
MALCPPSGAELDGGGHYTPSRTQRVIWNWWEEFWGEWVPEQTCGRPFIIVHNGDAIDGNHHNSTTQFTHNLTDQKKLGVRILRPLVNLSHGQFYLIRGTEVHVGQSGSEEEALAKELGLRPNEDGNHALWELWLKLGDQLIHFLHHIGTTASSAHESSAVNAEITAELVEAARWGEKSPTVVVRSHRHRSIEVRLPTSRGYITGVCTPAWQAKTGYAYRVAGARLAPPQMGGIIIRLGDSGKAFTNTFVRHIQRSNVVEA